MPRDSRIAYIINQLGELRELLLVIEQSGDAAPGILLKLAKEKAEEISRSTQDLRSPYFWEELQKHEPFAQSAPTPKETIETRPIAPEQTEETSTEPEREDTEKEKPEEKDDTIHIEASHNNPEKALAEEISPGEEEQGKEEVTPKEREEEACEEKEEEETEEDTLYPWEKLSDEERSIAQNDKEDDFDIESEEEEEEMEEYDENDIYEDSEESAGANNPDETTSTVTLEEALQRQQAKELRKALSLNDRFRFRRELFGNSDIRMNETLALIDAMNSYEEAEDYILNDLNWDEENTEVAEFMKIVQKHFL